MPYPYPAPPPEPHVPAPTPTKKDSRFLSRYNSDFHLDVVRNGKSEPRPRRTLDRWLGQKWSRWDTLHRNHSNTLYSKLGLLRKQALKMEHTPGREPTRPPAHQSASEALRLELLKLTREWSSTSRFLWDRLTGSFHQQLWHAYRRAKTGLECATLPLRILAIKTQEKGKTIKKDYPVWPYKVTCWCKL